MLRFIILFRGNHNVDKMWRTLGKHDCEQWLQEGPDIIEFILGQICDDEYGTTYGSPER